MVWSCFNTIKKNFAAVSYTHLDVYKRQPNKEDVVIFNPFEDKLTLGPSKLNATWSPSSAAGVGQLIVVCWNIVACEL